MSNTIGFYSRKVRPMKQCRAPKTSCGRSDVHSAKGVIKDANIRAKCKCYRNSKQAAIAPIMADVSIIWHQTHLLSFKG